MSSALPNALPNALPSLLLDVAVRAGSLGAGIAAYYVMMPVLFPDDGGGADIGAGLIAFGLLVAVSGGWGLRDGARQPFATACLVWSATGLLVAVGWLVARAVVEADASMTAAEIVVADLGGLPFTAALVVVPALTAAAIGSTQRPQVGAG